MMTYTKDTLRQIFQQPFNMSEWQQMLQHYFHAKDLRKEPEPIKGTTEYEKGYYLGALDTSDSYRIGLFYYQIQRGNVARKRVGLRNLVKSFINPDWGEFDAALVVFDSDSVWRLSFVCDIKGENTAAKRFTYVFGENDNYYNTPVGRFDALQRNGISFENIKDAFSVERLNKDFFNGYKERYVKFLKHINDDTKESRDYVKKLLGRLVFLQFLQKKGWMGVPANQQGWNGGDKFYLNHLIERYEGNDRLLSDVLEPLFFNTLNERRKNDLVDSRLGENIKIPYLNGGLFDKDELDKKDIDFPYNYFKELMDFFAIYNFTIDENDPEDSEIGIDPEMLGHIFENLLEDNKDKGAFYTPKEIVQYMSEVSIVQYLKTHTEETLHLAINELIKERKVSEILQNKTAATTVYKLLSDVKVCDPSIGSGAFPMGVLNVLYHARLLLYGFTKPTQDFSPAEVKREIIQNNIYGVDIEKGAIDIARLRFWLSIVVDSEQPEALPNFDYKFMQGNSLLEQYKGVDLSSLTHKKTDATGMLTIFEEILDMHRENLRNKITEYFVCSEHDKKTELKKEITDIVKLELREQSIDIDFEEMDLSANSHFFLWRTWFNDVFDKGGFDVVIGNPPYVQLQSNGGELAYLYDRCGYSTFARTGDIYCLFYERGWQLLKKNGHLCYITSNKWMRAGYGEKTREFFANKTNPMLLIDFAGVKIFESATVDTNILLFSKSNNQHETVCAVTNKQNKDSVKNLSDFVQQQNSVCDFATSDSWVILSPIEQSIKKKIESVGTPLKDWDINIYRGILTGCNEAFIIDSQKRDEILNNCQTEDERQRTAELIRPILRGRDIKRYGYDWANLYLIATFPSRHYDIDRYPAVKQYLLSFEEENLRNSGYEWVADNYLADFCKQKLSQTGKFIEIIGKRITIGNTPEKARKKTSNKWFETQDSISYWDLFFQPHICWKAVGRNLAFALVGSGVFLTAPASFISGGVYNETILHYLCSKVGTYFIYKNSDTTGAGDIMLNIQSLIKFPVPVGQLNTEGLSYNEINNAIYITYGFTNAEIAYIESQI